MSDISRRLVQEWARREDVEESVAWRRVMRAGMLSLGLMSDIDMRSPGAVVDDLSGFRPMAGAGDAKLVALREKMALVPARGEPVQAEAAVTYRGKPLPENYILDRSGRPVWNGPVDADGNPLQDGA